MSDNQDQGACGGSDEDRLPRVEGAAPVGDDDTNFIAYLQNFLEKLRISGLSATNLTKKESEEKPKPEQVLREVTFQGVAEFIAEKKCKNVIVMCGAGISTASGIPDFRSPGSGLYHNLQKYDLPSPQAIFEIDYFKQNPKPFFTLAKELYPGQFKPTVGHYFIKLLENKCILLRVYTQNIDTLEIVAGINEEKIVEAHGSFHTSHCLSCKVPYTQEWMHDALFRDEIPTCTKEGCNGIVKPDIVFFGEALPMLFHQRRVEDFKKCDLLIVMGTSLKVQPFASLVDLVPETTPRLLINREKSGTADPIMMMMTNFGGGMRFNEEDNYRDVFWEGNCDDGCRALCTLLGWLGELDSMVALEHGRIDARSKSSNI